MKSSSTSIKCIKCKGHPSIACRLYYVNNGAKFFLKFQSNISYSPITPLPQILKVVLFTLLWILIVHWVVWKVFEFKMRLQKGFDPIVSYYPNEFFRVYWVVGLCYYTACIKNLLHIQWRITVGVMCTASICLILSLSIIQGGLKSNVSFWVMCC